MKAKVVLGLYIPIVVVFILGIAFMVNHYKVYDWVGSVLSFVVSGLLYWFSKWNFSPKNSQPTITQ